MSGIVLEISFSRVAKSGVAPGAVPVVGWAVSALPGVLLAGVLLGGVLVLALLLF